MEGLGRAQGRWASVGLGLGFLGAGALAFLSAPADLRWQLGGAGLFLGLFVIVVLGPWGEPETPEASGFPQLYAFLEHLAADLELEASAVYLPAVAIPGLTADRIFLADDPERHTAWDAVDPEQVLQVEGGVAVEPPGARLLADHEEQLGVSLAELKLSQAEAELRTFGGPEGHIRDLTFHVRDEETVVVRYEDSTAGEVTGPVREEAPGMASRIGAPIQSGLLLGLARCLGDPIAVREISEEDREVRMEVTRLVEEP